MPVVLSRSQTSLSLCSRHSLVHCTFTPLSSLNARRRTLSRVRLYSSLVSLFSSYLHLVEYLLKASSLALASHSHSHSHPQPQRQPHSHRYQFRFFRVVALLFALLFSSFRCRCRCRSIRSPRTWPDELERARKTLERSSRRTHELHLNRNRYLKPATEVASRRV